MVLNAREELFQLIEKLPESKVEKVLEFLKHENLEFNYQIQDDFIEAVEQFCPSLKVTIDTHGDRAATMHITAQQRGAGNPLIQWLREDKLFLLNSILQISYFHSIYKKDK